MIEEPAPTPAQRLLVQLLDDLVATVQDAHPGVEFALHVSGPTSLLMPADGSRPNLWRRVEGRRGYHHTASYRRHEIVPEPGAPDHVISCVAVRDDAAEPVVRYDADLTTGAISRTTPE